MRLTLSLGFALLVGTTAIYAQDAVKQDPAGKPAPTTQAASPLEKRQEVERAERELRDAQQAIQQTQKEVRKAHREADHVAREQALTARAKAKAAPGMRLSVVRSGGPEREIRPGMSQLFTTFGMELVEADAVLRSQLGLPDDQGLVITQIAPKRLADQAGLRVNDVVLKLDDKAVGKVSQVQEALSSVGKRSVAADLIREGRPRKISIVGPEHGIPEAPVSYWIGVPVAPVDATLRTHLNALPDGSGLIAIDVVAASPAARAGIRKNDILIKFNDQPLASQEALVKLIQASEGKDCKIDLLRAGKPLTLNLTPEKRANETVAVASDRLRLVVNGSVGDRLGWIQPFRVKLNDDGSQAVSGDVQPTMITVTPGLTGWPNKLTGANWPGVTPTPQLEQQMKELTAGMEELRKAIEELKRSLPTGKDDRTGFALPVSRGGPLIS